MRACWHGAFPLMPRRSISAPSATTLSFDYDLALGDSDFGDYLQFKVNATEQW
ncbi:MAG: hypothetical protein HY885_15635 [Deltaproteobacteria bacterium]|nr:hypothetical protein [Deltaproteobacteria bacterium]